MSGDSFSSPLLVGLREEEGGGRRRIIFKNFESDGRIEGLGLLANATCYLRIT